MKKFTLIIIISVLLTACGDFPDYRYEQSEEHCVLNFPFAGGLFGRKYIGYFNLVSTLQYLDSDPELSIFIGEPSHIELEPGSVQKVEIDGKNYVPEFHLNYLHAELQYWGPAFTFSSQQAEQIYHSLQQGNNLIIHGRLEVGRQYETKIYNFFFDDTNAPLESCVNRLLNQQDMQELAVH